MGCGIFNRKFHAVVCTRGVMYDYYLMSPSGTQLAAIAKLIENKAIVPVVDKVFSLDDTEAAFAYAEAGHATGKVIITPYQDTGK
jgi:alcohol dehydrogenase